MNVKIVTCMFLLLLLGILCYPPFLWDTRSENDPTIRMQLPIKKHALVFGGSTQQFQLKHFPETPASNSSAEENAEFSEKMKNVSDEELNRMIGIVPLHRTFAFPDLAVEIAIAFIVSCLTGLIFRGKWKLTG